MSFFNPDVREKEVVAQLLMLGVVFSHLQMLEITNRAAAGITFEKMRREGYVELADAENPWMYRVTQKGKDLLR